MRKYCLFFAWIIASVSTLMSLYYSLVLKGSPCMLCWYQRVCMFPLAVILGIATYRSDKNVWFYIIPQTFFGAAIAVYQVILQEVPGFDISPCKGGISCLTKNYFIKPITMPMMSMAVFLVIAGLVSLYFFDSKN